jgi:putative nucleotidyltransferase with HDIG domain
MLSPTGPLSSLDARAAFNEAQRLDTAPASIAQALINAMEAKSPFLRGHSHRVAAAAASIAAELGLDEDMVEQIRLAGSIHDIGKIGIRESVLDKPAQLTAEEFAHVQEHVRIGLEILAPLRRLGPLLTFIAHHHERRDGSGYPTGLRGNDISLGGRIIAAADAFDALTSPRAYRDARTPEQAISFLESMGERGVCPVVLPALRRVVQTGRVLVFIDAA